MLFSRREPRISYAPLLRAHALEADLARNGQQCAAKQDFEQREAPWIS
jgi:hypothetical protein